MAECAVTKFRLSIQPVGEWSANSCLEWSTKHAAAERVKAAIRKALELSFGTSELHKYSTEGREIWCFLDGSTAVWQIL
jgi:hypothetical protein